MTELDRRTVLAGVGAMGAAALLPTVAAAALTTADVIDPEIERLRIWVDQIFRGLRAEGIALVRPPNGGGALIFWLKNDDDLTSMQLVELSEDVFL
ncbi:hypothetical protein [Bradyrhizobium sp.]